MSRLKRKRVSKKNKKSWRKNVDIQDVEDFLDEKRFEERTGFVASALGDKELFEIDVGGDWEKNASFMTIEKGKQNDCSRTSEKEGEVQKPEESDNCMRVKENKTLKCFEVLEKRSAVPDPVIKRNRRKTPEERRHPAVKRAVKARLEKGILTNKEKKALKNRRRAEKARKRLAKPQIKFNRDLWGKENKRELDKYSEWLGNDTVRHTLYGTGIQRKVVPKSVKEKTSCIPAVEEPHPGLSYNPSLKDHNDILSIVVEKEKKLIEEEKHLARVTSDLFSKVSEETARKEWLKEMSSGLFPSNENDEDESVTGNYSTVNPPVKNKKKTLKKRRKLREEALLKAKLREKKVEKKKLSDLHKLRQFNAAIKRREARLKKLKAKREKLKEQKRFKTKTLSQRKYEDPEVDFNTAEDLSGNLRGIKTDANLLLDRFKSLQKRNILEPTVKHFPKKVKKKRYERQCTKMGWEPKGY